MKASRASSWCAPLIHSGRLARLDGIAPRTRALVACFATVLLGGSTLQLQAQASTAQRPTAQTPTAQTPTAAPQAAPTADDAQRRIDSLLPLRASSTRDSALALAYRHLGEALDEGAASELSGQAFRRALVLARAVHDSTTLSRSHNGLGLQHWQANRYDSALTHLLAARDLRVALGDRAGLARTTNSIGSSYYQLGVYEPALDAFLQARDIWREQGDERGLSTVLTNIGKTYHDWGQYSLALPVLDEAVEHARRVGSPAVLGYAFNTLAELHLAMGNFSEARAAIDESRAAYTDSPTISQTDSLSAWSLNAMIAGRLALSERRYADALATLDSVRAAAMARGSVRGEARALLHLGEAYRGLGERTRAIEALSRSLALSRSIEQRVLAYEAVEQLADVEESLGNARVALAHLRAAEALRDTIFDQSTAQRLVAMEARAESVRQTRENTELREAQRIQTLTIERQQAFVMLGSVILVLAAALVTLLGYFMRRGRAREVALAQSNANLADANAELNTLLSEVRTLKGLIPICSSCKSVRDDEGYWEAVETYIGSRSDAIFSHSICQSCGPKLYGEHWDDGSAPVASRSSG